MGGKRNRTKTKWRKVPLGDLVAADESPDGETSRKSRDSTDDAASESGSFCPDDVPHDNSDEASYPEIQFFGAQLPGGETPIAYIGTDGHCYYQTSDLRNGFQQPADRNTDERKVSGCYVNGLWIPEAELFRHIPGFPPPDVGADLPRLPPNAVYHHVPWVRLRPVINSSEGPVFQQTGIGPTPNNLHYCLYFNNRRPATAEHYNHHQSKCCWKVPRKNYSSPYWCHGNQAAREPNSSVDVRPPNEEDRVFVDGGQNQHETESSGYLYPGYAFGPPVFDTHVREDSTIPPSSLPLHNSVKLKKKKHRRKMKPDSNEVPSTENVYDQRQRIECNGFCDSSPEATPDPLTSEMDEEVKQIEDFVQEFVYLTVAEAQQTLGHLLSGSNGTDLTEDSSLSVMSITDSFSEEMPHCEQQSAVENYVLQLLDEIVDGALDRIKQLHRNSTERDEKCRETSENQECESVERFCEEFLNKIFDEIRKEASIEFQRTVHEKERRVKKVEPCKDFLFVERNKMVYSPLPEDVSDLFSVQRNDFEKTMVLEQSGYLERLVSSIISSAVMDSSVLQTMSCSESTLTVAQVNKPIANEPTNHEQSQKEITSIAEQVHAASKINDEIGQLPKQFEESAVGKISSNSILLQSQDNAPDKDVNMTSGSNRLNQDILNQNNFPDYIECNKTKHNVEPNETPLSSLNLSDDLEERYMTDPSNSWLSHTEALIKETELELNRLQSKVRTTDQSIYKLSYDEDHSETEESEPNVPTITDRYVRDRSEIIVHEMDTASEAGSEDVELIPHRFDSPSTLEKHLYVNKLSLATELLRTKERIPYDEEFKMIVKEGGLKVDDQSDGQVNQGFDGDSVVAGGNRMSNISTVDSGVQSEESGDERAVEAREALEKSTNEGTEELENRANSSASGGRYRRFGARTFGVLKGNPFPCWCCNVM